MAKYVLSTSIEICASAERIWQALTDFSAYPDWNPFIVNVEGQAVTGARLEVRIRPPESKGMTFKPKVLVAEPNRELRWLGHLVVPGLFDGEHAFRIESSEGGHLKFTQEESFRGILVPLFFKRMEKPTMAGFAAMNQALKQLVEQKDRLG